MTNPRELTLYDNTRLRDHRKCNRYFYWRHRRDFTSRGINAAADFGSIWSLAMDVVWPAILAGHDNTTVVELGMDAFVNGWKGYNLPLLDEMTEEQTKIFSFRNEQTAAAMLQAYVELRREFISRTKLITVEEPFLVPLSPTNKSTFYVGKIDKVIEWDGGLWGLDHKTTSWYRKAGGFAPDWLNGWHLRAQLDGYIHSLRSQYGSRAKGILVDAALVHRDIREFNLIPIDKVTTHLESWLWEVMHEIAIIEANDRNLETHRAERGFISFMPAFPKNDNSCISFMKRCPYWDLCLSVADPESITEPPEGFEESRWEPFDELGLAKLVESSE